MDVQSIFQPCGSWGSLAAWIQEWSADSRVHARPACVCVFSHSLVQRPVRQTKFTTLFADSAECCGQRGGLSGFGRREGIPAGDRGNGNATLDQRHGGGLLNPERQSGRQSEGQSPPLLDFILASRPNSRRGRDALVITRVRDTKSPTPSSRRIPNFKFQNLELASHNLSGFPGD